jgi:hypothetical protein
MGWQTGNIEAVPGSYFPVPLGQACMCMFSNLKYVNMKNRLIYIGKQQIIVEHQLFHNNNLTFNTLTSKF